MGRWQEVSVADKTTNIQQETFNPFTPEFGKVPAYFAGREQVLSDILSAFEEQTMNLCALFVGPRGCGKTALLTYLGNEASRLGWVVANVSATSGMLEDIVQRTEESASHLIAASSEKRLTGVNIAGIGGATWDAKSNTKANWRTRMNNLLERLGEADIGLLITVDEVDVSLDEMSHLVSTYQHFVRENRKVALVMAGLPFHISSLLSGKNTSFLRRAQRFELGPLAPYEVEEAFRLTVEEGGRLINEEALGEAVEAIDGFPFMLQLLGYRAWRMHPDDAFLSVDDVRAGAQRAQRELEDRIFDVTYAELSRADRAFLAAMAQDGKTSRRIDLMERLGKPSGHISTYKKRLVQSGVIGETLDGDFYFALPGFKEYIAHRQG